MPSAAPKVRCAMRALQVIKPGSVKLTELPTPHPPAGHVLVRVHASAIQPSDIANLNGGFPETVFPRVPGRDFAGVVASVGEGVSSSLIDTPVFGTSGNTHAFTHEGFQAEYAVISEAECTPKPEKLSFIQAATIGVPLSTASLMVKRAFIQKGDKVLVLGANGAVGSAVCQLLSGQHVLKGVRGAGGDVDTKADPELKSLDKIDVVIDTVGSPELTQAAIDKLALGGRCVFISAPKNIPTPELTIKMRDFYREEKMLIGVNSVSKSASDMAKLLTGIDESILVKYADAEKRWTEINLDEAVDAYQDKTSGKKYVIKLE